MELAFPQVYIENNFSEQLRSFSGPTPFDKLRQAYKRARANRDDNRDKYSAELRFDTNRYFYFPGEPSVPRNCFEIAVEMFMTAKELYPQSEPKLFYMDQGRRGTHAFTTFNHKGTIYRADPNYDAFGPFHIINGKAVTPGQEAKKGESEVKEIREISESALASLVGKLRTEEGIIPYLNGGGQVIEKDVTSFRPYEIFMRLDGKTLTSDLRYTDFAGAPSTAFRFQSNLQDESFRVKLLIYTLNNWGELMDARKVAQSPVGVREKGVTLSERSPFRYLEKMCYDEYMMRWIKYVGNIAYFSKKDNIPLEETYMIAKEKIRKKTLRSFKKENPQAVEFAEKRSPHYLMHMAEWRYLASIAGLKQSYPKKKWDRWRDMRRKKYKDAKAFTGHFIGVFYQTSDAQVKRLSGLNGRAFWLTKDAMSSESE